MCASQFSIKEASIVWIAIFAFFVCLSFSDESHNTDDQTYYERRDHIHNPGGRGGDPKITVSGGSYSHATRDDIKFLQDQINDKSYKIDAIHHRLTALEYQTKNLSRQHESYNYKFQDLKDKHDYALGSLESLRQADIYLNISLSSSHKKIGLFRTDVNHLESSDIKLRQEVEGTNQRMGQIDVSIRHLNEVNQLWKSNFRALNITITNLRRKVNF